jgi:DNA-binding protein H-NS
MATRKIGTTLSSLNTQIKALQAQADTLRKSEVAEVIAKVKDAIARYSLTATDLGFGKAAGPVAKSPAAAGSKPAKKGRKRAVAKPAAKTVKFKDDQGHTWGGIGKRPDWFKAALAAGKTPEDLLAKV